jgi:hypothetical protein
VLVEEIKSKEDFIFFIEELTKDFEENSQQWENQDLTSYFESIKAWLEDIDDSNLEGNIWRVISRIILAPKFYE